MPPWAASVPRSTTHCSRRAIGQLSRSPWCCDARSPRAPLLRFRAASTHVSPTAINYSPSIPHQNRELYDALSHLNEKAEQHANTNRLQLALRVLTAENAVTRVAVLGLDGQASARRLARALLADPLVAEDAWEIHLENGEEDGPVLLRCGDEHEAHSASPPCRILSVPSRFLEMHNMEMLVSTLNVNVPSAVCSPADSPLDTVLVPKLQSTSARGLPMPYPVHKTLILGEGLDNAIAYGKYMSDNTESSSMVKVAIDLPPPAEEVDVRDSTEAVPVNIDTATQALDILRTSVQNATAYERKWFASNLPALSKWLTQDLKPASSMAVLKPAHIAFISSILDSIETSITRADAQHLANLSSASSPSTNQLATEMASFVEAWAERGHTELRDSLDDALLSKTWRRLAWWKLFWRVDDVGMTLEEVLQRHWLIATEQDAVFLAGRMKQAGFPDTVPQAQPAAAPEPAPADTNMDSTPEAPLAPQTSLSTALKPKIPWPAILPTVHALLVETTLPPLHALAQRLILTTLSTTSLSAALSALLYVSASSVSVFEAGGVAALGLVFSLRRMQTVWERAREAWMGRVREEGRQALKEVERDVKMIVGARGRETRLEEDDGVRKRREAREAVRRVRGVLERLGG